MTRRMELHAKLVKLLGIHDPPFHRVYFQPPASYKLKYPCIVYERDVTNSRFADNRPYRTYIGYLVTYMDEDPDNHGVFDKLAALPMSLFDRHFTAGQINHDVFRIYY